MKTVAINAKASSTNMTMVIDTLKLKNTQDKTQRYKISNFVFKN